MNELINSMRRTPIVRTYVLFLLFFRAENCWLIPKQSEKIMVSVGPPMFWLRDRLFEMSIRWKNSDFFYGFKDRIYGIGLSRYCLLSWYKLSYLKRRWKAFSSNSTAMRMTTMVLKSVTFLTMRASYIADEDHDDNNVDVTGSGL